MGVLTAFAHGGIGARQNRPPVAEHCELWLSDIELGAQR